MNKKVSVIVPVYNVEQYLLESVDSILRQSYQDIEVILVDDGSPDNCPSICDEYANLDKRVRVVHKSNGGLSDARNAGLDVATGVYITFTDSDDIIDPKMIEEMVKLLESNNADMISCESVFYQNGEESVIPHYHKAKGLSEIYPIEFLKGLLDISIDCSVCNKLYKYDLIKDYRFAVGKYNEDVLFQFEVIPTFKKIIHTNQGYYKYRITESSITHSFNIRSLDRFYNSLYLYGHVKENYPSLLANARRFLLNACQAMIDNISQNKLTNQEPFLKVYKSAKKTLMCNSYFILFSPLYSLRRKASIFKTLLTVFKMRLPS